MFFDLLFGFLFWTFINVHFTISEKSLENIVKKCLVTEMLSFTIHDDFFCDANFFNENKNYYENDLGGKLYLHII